MKNFRDLLVRKAYHDIREGRMSVDALIEMAERYLKVKTTEQQRVVLYHYANLIKNDELSFEEYWRIYQEQKKKYFPNI